MTSSFSKPRLTFFILILAIILFPTITFADAKKIFKENTNAVVVVVTYDSKGNPIRQGSGFIVRADGAIVTNYHVISNAKDIKVKIEEKVLNVEGLILVDKERDIVILKVKGENLQKVKLGDFEKTNIGEKIYVISSPQGLENTISDGILSGIREITHERNVLQITAPISSGSSGGPVFNENGEVIGVATFILEESQNLNFAMPVNFIKDKIDTKKVIALRDSEIEDYEKTVEYWFYRGVKYGDSGRHKDAIEAYKQAIKINPDNSVIHYNLGITYGELGRYKDAIEAFKQAIRIKPDYAEIHYNLGVSYFMLSRYKDAIKAYKQAIRIEPDYAKAHYNLGITCFKLARDKDAIEAYKQAIKINPDDAKAHYNLGITYFFINDKGSALEEYKILKNLDPKMANKLFNLIYK